MPRYCGIFFINPDNKNQLLKVNYLSNSPQGFKDNYTSTENDFSYDNNGNMTADVNKEIESITYNHLNLPIKINFGAKGNISYLYNALGQKVQKKVVDASTTNTTDYLTGFQYKNTILDFFAHAEGYVKFNYGRLASPIFMFSYVFNYTDHLGNIRVSYSKDPSTNVLKILEENHYYPFGLKHTNYNSDKLMYIKEADVYRIRPVAPVLQTYKYKYNGKELQDELGLNMYDYGARNYDPAIGRWMNVDPLAEKYPGVSPYVYCLNNPLNVIDPDGRDIIFIIDKESANKNGHIAVLIGNEKTGWKYVSMNGTGAGAKPWGKSKNPDLGTSIVDDKGRMISDPKKAIQRANVINPNENEHTYDAYKRIISTEEEDSNALTEASESASAKKYGIAGPGKSCIDVAQAAFGSIVKDKGLDDDGDVPGESDLIPNNWFDKLDARVKEANANTSEKGKKIEFVIPKKAEKKD